MATHELLVGDLADLPLWGNVRALETSALEASWLR